MNEPESESKRERDLLETSQHQTAPLWPRQVPRRSPLSANQTVGVWSFAQEKSRSPSRLYFKNVSGLSWPFIKIGLIFTKSSKEEKNHVAVTRTRVQVRKVLGFSYQFWRELIPYLNKLNTQDQIFGALYAAKNLIEVVLVRSFLPPRLISRQ